jgi:hypothetical protein
VRCTGCSTAVHLAASRKAGCCASHPVQRQAQAPQMPCMRLPDAGLSALLAAARWCGTMCCARCWRERSLSGASVPPVGHISRVCTRAIDCRPHRGCIVRMSCSVGVPATLHAHCPARTRSTKRVCALLLLRVLRLIACPSTAAAVWAAARGHAGATASVAAAGSTCACRLRSTAQ